MVVVVVVIIIVISKMYMLFVDGERLSDRLRGFKSDYGALDDFVRCIHRSGRRIDGRMH